MYPHIYTSVYIRKNICSIKTLIKVNKKHKKYKLWPFASNVYLLSAEMDSGNYNRYPVNLNVIIIHLFPIINIIYHLAINIFCKNDYCPFHKVH